MSFAIAFAFTMTVLTSVAVVLAGIMQDVRPHASIEQPPNPLVLLLEVPASDSGARLAELDVRLAAIRERHPFRSRIGEPALVRGSLPMRVLRSD